jgi:hypothetical protein
MKNIPNAQEKLNSILKYCQPHVHDMWAANIVGSILECDFRDAQNALNVHFYTNQPIISKVDVNRVVSDDGVLITKREQFAAMAMQGLVSGDFRSNEISAVAILAVDLADALIAELGKTNE